MSSLDLLKTLPVSVPPYIYLFWMHRDGHKENPLCIHLFVFALSKSKEESKKRKEEKTLLTKITANGLKMITKVRGGRDIFWRRKVVMIDKTTEAWWLK